MISACALPGRGASRPEQLQAILAGNAAKLYDFDLDALAPLAALHGPTVDELAQPLRQMPADANDALLKSVALVG